MILSEDIEHIQKRAMRIIFSDVFNPLTSTPVWRWFMFCSLEHDRKYWATCVWWWLPSFDDALLTQFTLYLASSCALLKCMRRSIEFCNSFNFYHMLNLEESVNVAKLVHLYKQSLCSLSPLLFSHHNQRKPGLNMNNNLVVRSASCPTAHQHMPENKHILTSVRMQSCYR